MRQKTAFILRLEEQIRTLERFPTNALRWRRKTSCSAPPIAMICCTVIIGTLFKTVGSRVIILRVLHGARLLDTGILEELEK